MRYPFDGNYRVTSGYGWRIHPITGSPALHAGIDFATPTGTPLVAVADGTVSFAAYDGGAGNHLVILLDTPVAGQPKVGYMHLDRFAVQAGQRVREGQLVAYADNTGSSTGTHLHFWLGRSGTDAIDPAPHLSHQVTSTDITPSELDRWLFGPTGFGLSRFEAQLEQYLFGPTGFGLSRFEAAIFRALQQHGT